MIKKLDDFLLAAFTKVAHKFQRLTGRTNYFLAKIGLMLTLTSLSVGIMSYVLPILDTKPPLFFVFLFGILAMMEVWRMVRLDAAEKDATLSVERAKHFFPTDNLTSRMVWLCFSVIDIVSTSLVASAHKTVWAIISHTFFSTGLFLFHYFIAVNPLPPCKSKVKEFLESISASLSPAKPAENEAP